MKTLFFVSIQTPAQRLRSPRITIEAPQLFKVLTQRLRNGREGTTKETKDTKTTDAKKSHLGRGGSLWKRSQANYSIPVFAYFFSTTRHVDCETDTTDERFTRIKQATDFPASASLYQST